MVDVDAPRYVRLSYLLSSNWRSIMQQEGAMRYFTFLCFCFHKRQKMAAYRYTPQENAMYTGKAYQRMYRYLEKNGYLEHLKILNSPYRAGKNE